MRVADTRMTIHGAEQLGPDEAYVVVSNHESNWDSPILIAAFPQLCIRFVAKKQLLQIPVFGRALRVSGNIIVDRDRRGTDLKRIDQQMSVRASNVSILFFAEGRRSRDGSFHAFKMGAFATALSHGLPILPVAVAGSRRLWPPGGLRIRPGLVAIEVGAPIPVDGLEFADRQAVRDQTRELIGKLRARARERLRDMDVDPPGGSIRVESGPMQPSTRRAPRQGRHRDQRHRVEYRRYATRLRSRVWQRRTCMGRHRSDHGAPLPCGLPRSARTW